MTSKEYNIMEMCIQRVGTKGQKISWKTQFKSRQDWDNIASCLKRRGNKQERNCIPALMSCTGWDITHDRKNEINALKKELSEANQQIYLLKLQLRGEQRKNIIKVEE